MQSVRLLNNKTSGFKWASGIDLNAPEYIHAGCLYERSDLLYALYENHTGYINKDFPSIRIYDACSNNMAMFLHHYIHCTEISDLLSSNTTQALMKTNTTKRHPNMRKFFTLVLSVLFKQITKKISGLT